MFEFVKKYGATIGAIVHRVADVIEADGPMVVDALRTVGGFVTGPLGAGVAIAGQVIEDAIEVAPKVAASANPLRATAAAAVAAVDGDIAAGAFRMPGEAPAGGAAPGVDVAKPAFANPLRT